MEVANLVIGHQNMLKIIRARQLGNHVRIKPYFCIRHIGRVIPAETVSPIQECMLLGETVEMSQFSLRVVTCPHKVGDRRPDTDSRVLVGGLRWQSCERACKSVLAVSVVFGFRLKPLGRASEPRRQF